MANYVKFKQGLKKDFNTTNQPLTNGMIYFVIDENNNGSIYYDTIVDGKQATKNGTVHRVKFSGLPIKITGSVTGTGVISQDGEIIEINTSTNHSHGLVHQNFTVRLSDDDTNLKWTRLGNQNSEGFWLKSIRGQAKAPAWFLPDYSAGIAFGGEDTKGIISVKYRQPGVRFAGGNGDAPVWYFTITGSNDKSYDLNGIGGHSSDSAKLDHNLIFKIASTADATNGANGTKTDLSGSAVNLYLPTKISGFDLLQASRFQGNADSATYATSAGYAKGLFLNPETRQEDMNFNLADAKYIKRVTYSMATSTTKKNKPPIGDANILSFGWDNSGYGSQLAIQNGSAGHLAVRGSGSNNGTSSWGEWSTVLDSSNYTSYINNYYWANVKVSTASSTETKPTFNTAYTSNWWRSTGKTGWWNDTYSGGIAMEDKTYVKVAGNKSFLIPKGSLKIGGNGDIFFATGDDDATLKIYGQTNTDFGIETIAIQTCFDNEDPQTSGYTTQYANRCNLLLQPRGGQVYIGKNLTAVGDTEYKLLVDGNQWTSGSQWVNGNLLFTDITGNTADTGMSLKGIYGRIGGNDGWRIAGGARANNTGYLEIATNDDMSEPIYVRQYGGGAGWNGYRSLARTFTLLDAAGRSRAPELFEAKKIHVNSLLDQSVAIADISYQFQVTGTSNFTDSVDISGVTTHHNHIQIDANYSIARPGRSSSWFGSHNNAMIRMTSVNDWSPLLAQKATNGYWILGHYNHYNEKNKNDDFRNQWVFGYLADSNLEGTTGASNSLTTTYRLLNIGDQRMFVSAKYNAAVGSGTQPVYVQSNGNVATCSYSLGATIEAGTANRMAYYKTANQIGSSGHYVTSNQVGINASSSKNYTFYVGGNSLFNSAVTINGNVHILPDTDVGLNEAGSLVIGNKAGQNLGIDGNEIMARNNSKASALFLNNEGGIVQIGQNGITIQAKASSTNLQSGGLRISSENAGNSGNVALELYRGSKGSWQIANEGAILYFRTNWVGDRKTTYAKNALIIDHTTGSASLPYLAIGQEERNTTYGLYVVSSQSWIKNTLWTGNVYPDTNNAYNIGSTSHYWATGYINTLYVAGNAYANGSKRIPTTGNTSGTIGSATVPVYSDGGVLKTITSYSGNAATATTASKLSRNAGSATKPIYFSDGVPVQCNDTLGVNINGNAASATYTTQLLGVNESNTPYSAVEGNLIRAVWNVKGDSRWYLKAGSYNCRVNYADNAGNADTVDGYHAADLFSGGYKTALDLSALNNNLYYPVTGASIPANGYHKIKVSVHLNSGTKPSWATHNSGFTTNVELYTTACGWGATHGETIVLNDSYKFTNCGQVVGFTQNGNTSTPVLWLRGGGQYFVECDYNASWTIRTSLYYTQGSSSDTYKQTVEPQSSYPGFKSGDGGAINGVIRAGQVYGAVWNDYAEYRQIKKHIQPGYCVIETGKGDLIKSSERLQPGANIVSDTFGFAIGETEQTKTPLAVSGRVLAYPYEDRDLYQAGDPVCSGPNGTISKMTREEVREYPERIIGTVSEIPDYEVWGTGNVKVNNRIWIKVK